MKPLLFNGCKLSLKNKNKMKSNDHCHLLSFARNTNLFAASLIHSNI